MYHGFVAEADARELRAILGVAGRLAGKIVREAAALAWTVVRVRATKAWTQLREDAERGARGWR